MEGNEGDVRWKKRGSEDCQTIRGEGPTVIMECARHDTMRHDTMRYYTMKCSETPANPRSAA